MNRVRVVLVSVVLFVIVFLPGRASAQAHLQLLGGVTSAADEKPFFAGALGFRLSFLELDVEAGRFDDILSQGILDALNDLQRERGLPVQAVASVPATYGVASLRIIPGAGGIRPFVSGGFGAARLAPRLDVSVGGISLGDIFGLTSLEPQTKPMALASAGLRVEGRRVQVEGGYRYVVVFSDFKPDRTLDNDRVLTFVNAIYVALGVRF